MVRGKGFHFFVGRLTMEVIFAIFAVRQRSYKIVTTARSKSRFLRHRKLTVSLPHLCVTLILQNGSGTKFLTLKYRSTTNPRVGNWQEPAFS